ncbi:hypothetical protein EDD16DRAFT_1520181 [Pisolithus croceorrhizus]|nr:hypothetical protein EV401DRAFT_1893453 [Pisolithus croceorrhizus]KAI6117141.1 hypothetical protein EDD16DRAFT_1520181 [Pisolithus croceorrhizus]KAI6158465.1 hypothetical protein EDD17DRAFT_1512198 [Pisolithus thermaeus]
MHVTLKLGGVGGMVGHIRQEYGWKQSSTNDGTECGKLMEIICAIILASNEAISLCDVWWHAILGNMIYVPLNRHLCLVEDRRVFCGLGDHGTWFTLRDSQAQHMGSDGLDLVDGDMSNMQKVAIGDKWRLCNGLEKTGQQARVVGQGIGFVGPVSEGDEVIMGCSSASRIGMVEIGIQDIVHLILDKMFDIVKVHLKGYEGSDMAGYASVGKLSIAREMAKCASYT